MSLRTASARRVIGVGKNGKVRGCALVAFGANTRRPTIVCISEDALPKAPGSDWLIIARDSDFVPRARRDSAKRRQPSSD
jgi:hypothetical protein